MNARSKNKCRSLAIILALGTDPAVRDFLADGAVERHEVARYGSLLRLLYVVKNRDRLQHARQILVPRQDVNPKQRKHTRQRRHNLLCNVIHRVYPHRGVGEYVVRLANQLDQRLTGNPKDNYVRNSFAD